MHKYIKREQHLETWHILKSIYSFKNATVHKDVAGQLSLISYIFLICKLIELTTLCAV